MLKKFLGMMAVAALFVGCGDSGSDNNPASGGNDKQEETTGCNIKKESNVWKYTYSSWGYTDIYTWTDETTVKYESWMKSYHMEEDDKVMENQNRDELYEFVVNQCQRLQEM